MVSVNGWYIGSVIRIFLDDFFRELCFGKQAEGLWGASLTRKEPFLDSGIVNGGVHEGALGVRAGGEPKAEKNVDSFATNLNYLEGALRAVRKDTHATATRLAQSFGTPHQKV